MKSKRPKTPRIRSHQNRWRHLLAPVAMCVLLSVLASGGCDSDRAEPAAQGQGITRTASQGPVDVLFSVTPAKIDTTKTMRVELQIVAKNGVTVLDPNYETTLGEGDRAFSYRVVNRTKEESRPMQDGSRKWTYQYDLEFFLPSEHELPAAEVSYLELTDTDPARESEPAEVQTVTCEAVTVVVDPPPSGEYTAEQLQEITVLDPVELPRIWSRLWWIAPPAALLLIILLVWLMRRKRKQTLEAKIIIPAHQWARRKLAELVADQLLSKNQVQEFYYRISAIMRGYIERRYDVLAEEMTTEEFLLAAAKDQRFGQRTTEELNRFLTACDLVKYARHEPQLEESDQAIIAATEFVEKTRARPATLEQHDGQQPQGEERAA